MDLSVIAEPLGRVAVFRVNVCQRDGEVDQEEVKVVKLPIRKLFLSQYFHVLFGVECVPQL